MTQFLGRIVTPNRPSAPASPSLGELYYDTTTSQLLYWNGTAWIAGSGGGSGSAEINVSTAGPSPRVGELMWVDTDANDAPAFVQRVVSLPSSPTDGQEIYLQVTPAVTPADTTPLLWHLRYDLSLTAWLPVGRQEPVYAHRGLTEFFAFSSVNTWGGINANDPQVTVPRAGDYDVEWGAGIGLLGSAGNGTLGLQIAGVDPAATTSLGGADAAIVGHAETGSTWTKSGPGHRKLTGLAVGAVIKHRYATSVVGNVYRGNAYIKLYPRKITG